MIPSSSSDFSTDVVIRESPTKQHCMKDNGRITGICDGIDALRQTIFKILNTERYGYEIYSWEYGVEFADLIGQPITYCCPEIERRIREALTQDYRIMSVDAFAFETGRNTVTVTFTVHSIYGDINEGKVVNV